MILPLCGETVMGFLRYNREFPGTFYTVGVETDRSSYSHDVPFSCVAHYDRVISECIADWVDNSLEHYRRFGMDEGWTELMISEDYRSRLEPAAEDIHAQAIEMEESYAD
jgi:basic membrane lipoprotein Med (substrate-binding protein (PBP1-ABC) superfamily)